MRYKKAGEGLAKRITHVPLKMDVEHIYPIEKHATIKHLDDEKMVIDHSGVNVFVLGLSLFQVILWTWAYTVIERYDIFDAIVFVLIYGGSIFFLLKSLISTKKVFIFNRKKGTLTYPELLWRSSKTIPFSEACFIRNRVGPYAGENSHLAIIRADGITRTLITWDHPNEYFSFFVWYMDRNRPLPPGTAFDPYRERDYERRKAEGLQPPLYPADIDTPEYNKIQDKGQPKRKRTTKKQI